MQILVSIFTGPNAPNTDPIVAEHARPPGANPHGPGHRFVFSEDLRLEEYDGVPQNHQLAGTHSGFSTTLRIAGPPKPHRIYKLDSFLFHMESLYRFEAVAGSPLQKGQITAEGTFYGEFGVVNPQTGQLGFVPLEPNTLAITGGTGAYARAHGEITEPPPTPAQPNPTKLLNIQLP